MNNYLIISADCHAGPESPVYRDYLDPQYREAFDVELAEREAMIQAMREARGYGSDAMMGESDFQEEWFSESAPGASLHETGLRCGWDPDKRDEELDADGVTGEVVFHGPDAVTGRMGAPFGAGFVISADADPELVLAGARAYNRWAAELCATSPDRRAGLAVAPILGDIEGAVIEITRARESGLWGGVVIPAVWGNYPSYTDRRYDPIWAACQDLQMPIHTHSGPSGQDYGTEPGVLGLYAWETIWWTARPMWFMLWSGVFERFPRLKMAVTEAGSFWASDLLWRCDMLYARQDQGARKLSETVRGNLKMTPSDYFDRNIKIGSSNTRRRELARRYEIGVGNIMWGNDFPHPEGTWPYTRKILGEVFHDIPVGETERILGLNAAEFYGFDVPRLREISDRVGPTPEELGQVDETAVAKWAPLEEIGRPWLTGREATVVA